MNITRQFYDTHAKEYFDSTLGVDTSLIRERFLKYVPSGSRIMDLGCGSGRDSKAFLNMGYKVSAIDDSEELCKLARKYTGINVECADFMSLYIDQKYDAIWACASLLHVPYAQLPDIINKMKEAIVDNGLIYCSFKSGDFEGERDGRYYTDMTSDRFSNLLVNGLKIVEEWYSEDVMKNRTNTWYNVILRKE